MSAHWGNALQGHRDTVRDAIEDCTWQLVMEHGLLSVTMSRVATQVGISRATLYKYFPDVGAIVAAWHARQVTDHLHQLEEVAAGAGDPALRLQRVLTLYAQICAGRSEHGGDLADVLHAGTVLQPAQRRLVDLVTGVLREGVDLRIVRSDQPAQQLGAYALRALGAAADLPPGTDLTGLVHLVLAGLQPPTRDVTAV